MDQGFVAEWPSPHSRNKKKLVLLEHTYPKRGLLTTLVLRPQINALNEGCRIAGLGEEVATKASLVVGSHQKAAWMGEKGKGQRDRRKVERGERLSPSKPPIPHLTGSSKSAQLSKPQLPAL